MASKVMPPSNSDHHSQNPPSKSDHPSRTFTPSSSNSSSMNMDEILNTIYNSDQTDPFVSSTTTAAVGGGGGGGGDVGPSTKTVDEVWREIVAGGGGGGGVGRGEPEMTLEDFLTKAGAVTEDDVRAPPSTAAPMAAGGGFVVDNMMGTGNCQFSVAMQNGPPGGGGGYGGMEPPPPPHMGYGNGGVVSIGGGGSSGSGSGRGKRRSTVEELPLDKATQQKQRRMIKNRESAARSRERKQAYTVELESLVTQLEEENAKLLKEEKEKNKERLKQIMENRIPVVEKQRPPRVLRRVQSMSW